MYLTLSASIISDTRAISKQLFYSSFGYLSAQSYPQPSKFTKQKEANPSMAYPTTDTYKMKQKILNFARNFSGGLSAPDAKFLRT